MTTVIDTIAIITLTVIIAIPLSPSPTPPQLPALPCQDITILAVFSITATNIFVTTESLGLTVTTVTTATFPSSNHVPSPTTSAC